MAVPSSSSRLLLSFAGSERTSILVAIAALAGAITLLGCAPEERSLFDDDGSFDSATVDDFGELKFYGFTPSDLDDGVDLAKAKAGIDVIWSGRGFHGGFPTERIEAIERVRGFFGGYSDIVSDYRASGMLPSPPSRPSRVGGGHPPGLGQSYFWRSRDVDYGGPTTSGAEEFSNRNCFLCHAGVTNGQVIAGRGNADIDQAAAYDRLKKITKFERAILWSRGDGIIQDELLDFFKNAEETVEHTYGFATTRGDNFGPYAVWSHLSRLANPSETGLLQVERGSDGPNDGRYDDLFFGEELVTVDPNAWWLRKYRSVAYWYGENTANVSAHFAFNFTTPHASVNDTHGAHTQWIDEILEFAEHSTSPPFPGALQSDAVIIGAEIFHGRREPDAGALSQSCSACHGTYEKLPGTGFAEPGGWSVRYVDIRTDPDGQPRLDDSGNPQPRLMNVGTDSKYREVLNAFASIAEHGNRVQSYFDARGLGAIAPQSIVPEGAGYIAPPLVGVWASAPYFHNGSVPTLYHVLNSSARPKVWKRVNDNPFAYNLSRVGLRCDSQSGVCGGVMDTDDYDEQADRSMSDDEATDFRSLYATHLPGRSKDGHTFGDSLTDIERYYVIEFLKSLSGPNMPVAD